MSVMTLETAVRNLACDAVVDSIDAGAGAGYIQMETSGDVEIATLPMSDPAFGASSSGTATASAITSDTTATGGTIAQASVYDSNNAKKFELDAGTSGTYVIVSSTSVSANDTVAMSSFTVTCPAS